MDNGVFKEKMFGEVDNLDKVNEKIGEGAFCALNQLDKVMGLTDSCMDIVRQLSVNIEGFMFYADILSENSVRPADGCTETMLGEFTELAGAQQRMLECVEVKLQAILAEQEKAMNMVHNVEEAVAETHEVIGRMCELKNEDKGSI